MPCRYFEPLHLAADRQYVGARVPLLEEYDGVCHAAGLPVEAEFRFSCCNHGYGRDCGRLPAGAATLLYRYTVAARTGDGLEVLCIEEQQFAPQAWQRVMYVQEGERLEPEISDPCMRAQIVSFCRSYLKKFFSRSN